MKVQFELTIGVNKFTLTEDVESHTDFFEKLHFYSTLPKVGPNGETDLVLRFRVAQKQYKYYSIVSEKAGQEYKFGQAKEGKVLFGKGWEPIYRGDDEDTDQSAAPSVGLGAPAASVPTTQTVGLGAAPAPRAPAAAATSVGLGGPVAPKATPAPAPSAPVAAPVQAAPQVQQQAASILAKFGI